MNKNEQHDGTIYLVVVNDEEQYSIWPKWKKKLPLGWKNVGKEGSKEDCLTYIQEVWIDMRPLSLRKSMEEVNPNNGSNDNLSKLNLCGSR